MGKRSRRVPERARFAAAAPDPQVPLDESVSALAELQSEGKIRHIGLSNVSVNELRRAQRIAPIVSVQNRYNFSDRSSEDVLDECEKGGLAFLPWHPLAAGGDAAGVVRLARRAPPRRNAHASGNRLAASPLARHCSHSRDIIGGAP